MQSKVINVNGNLFAPTELEKAQISVLDRSFIYGDSLYEVVRTYQGIPFHMDSHLGRLDKSSQLCKFTSPLPLDQYRKEITRTIEAFHQLPGGKDHELYARLIVSRGSGEIGFSRECVTHPLSFVIIVKAFPDFTDVEVQNGISLCVSKRIRNNPRALDPAMKSGNYLNSLLAFLEAEEAGYEDALLCNADGHVTEGTVFNVYYCRRGIVATPPLEIGILDGISRQIVNRISKEEGFPLREVRFPKERLYEADEVFITGSTKEVFPVSKIDGKKIGNGKPGPITLQLRASFRKFANETVKNENKK